jgi:predicted phage tail protein
MSQELTTVDPAPVSAVGLPWIDLARRETRVFAAGVTLAEIVAAMIPSRVLDNEETAIRVTIGDAAFERRLWSKVRPQPGMIVVVRVLPGKPDALKAGLLLAATVAAVALGQVYLGPAVATGLGIAEGTALFAGTVSAVTGGLLLAGHFLVNTLVPQRSAQAQNAAGSTSQSYSIAGWSNPINPGGAVPFVLGRMRVALVHVARPYRDVYNGDVHSIALLTAGYGGVQIDDLRIRDTPIGDYKQLAYELRGGWEGEDPVTLYNVQVIEEEVAVELLQSTVTDFGPDVRRSASGANLISLEVTFPAGLISFFQIQSGEQQVMQQGPWTVNFRVQARPASSESWTVLGDWAVSGVQQHQLIATWEWEPPTQESYFIRFYRLDQDWDFVDQSAQEWRIISRSIWTALRTYRYRYPVNFKKPMSLVAVDVRATWQINGRVDMLNALVTRVALEWNAGSGTWSEAETENPASGFRWVAQGPVIAFPRSDDRLDLERLQQWHESCEARNLTYSRFHDFPSSFSEVLADIASAGRAVPIMRAGKLSVGVDEPKTEIDGWITPRNSRNFTIRRQRVRRPDAFRVRFRDRTNDYEWAERIVPRPDFIGDPRIVEELSPPGVTDPDAAYRVGLWRHYEMEFRKDEYSCEMDFEALTFERFSRVQVSNDMLNEVMKSARVRSVTGNIVRLDEIVEMKEGESYAVVFRHIGASPTGPDMGIFRYVVTEPGETLSLLLAGSGALPSVGDLAMFGLAEEVTLDCVVKRIESIGDLDRRIILVDHAPQIHEYTDAAEVPEWDGSVGADVETSYLAAAIPLFASILSSAISPAAGSSTLFVKLARSSAGGPVTSYRLQHRLQGSGGWTTIEFGASPGSTIITTYSAADIVELRAEALGPGGDSGYSDIVTHIVAATDPAPSGLTSFSAAQLDATTWRFTFATAPAGGDVLIKYRVGHWTSWANLTSQLDAQSSNPHDSTTPAITSATEYSFGARLIDSSGVESGAPIIVQVTSA